MKIYLHSTLVASLTFRSTRRHPSRRPLPRLKPGHERRVGAATHSLKPRPPKLRTRPTRTPGLVDSGTARNSLTPTQPIKSHTHACMGMGYGRLGEGQLWVGYGYNPGWVTLGYPPEGGNLVYTKDTENTKKKVSMHPILLHNTVLFPIIIVLLILG